MIRNVKRKWKTRYSIFIIVIFFTYTLYVTSLILFGKHILDASLSAGAIYIWKYRGVAAVSFFNVICICWMISLISPCSFSHQSSVLTDFTEARCLWIFSLIDKLLFKVVSGYIEMSLNIRSKYLFCAFVHSPLTLPVYTWSILLGFLFFSRRSLYFPGSKCFKFRRSSFFLPPSSCLFFSTFLFRYMAVGWERVVKCARFPLFWVFCLFYMLKIYVMRLSSINGYPNAISRSKNIKCRELCMKILYRQCREIAKNRCLWWNIIYQLFETNIF